VHPDSFGVLMKDCTSGVDNSVLTDAVSPVLTACKSLYDGVEVRSKRAAMASMDSVSGKEKRIGSVPRLFLPQTLAPSCQCVCVCCVGADECSLSDFV
jgi:hypothetical protein